MNEQDENIIREEILDIREEIEQMKTTCVQEGIPLRALEKLEDETYALEVRLFRHREDEMMSLHERVHELGERSHGLHRQVIGF